jgi:predicted histone-like DNA-binding protein
MAQKYCVRKKTNVIDKEKSKYFAVPVSSGLVGTKQLSSVISDRCTATESDVLAVLSALSAVMKDFLSDGYKVKLMDIGIFSQSVSSPGFDNPEDCTNKKVFAKRICFTADSELKKILKETEFVKVD